MMHPVTSFNRFHLGDCLVSLHLLRALAKQNPDRAFVFFCGAHYHDQLNEVVEDLPNLRLDSFESAMWARYDRVAVDLWKNADDAWVTSPLRWDWSGYTLWHHKAMARRLGFESPFTCREHLLFDYPAIDKLCHRVLEGLPETEMKKNWKGEAYIDFPCEFLIGDSAPNSGQYTEWADHSREPLESLISALSKKHVVLRTSQMKCSLSQIGSISRSCFHHIMVPNGPFFPTLNTFNHHENFSPTRRRIVLLDNGENLNMPFIEQVPNVEAVWEIARKEGWI